MSNELRRLQIGNTDVFLENLGDGRGKITISDTYNHNYSYFWGAMGGTIESFILSIDDGYFASKLMGAKSDYKMDVPKTFAAIRKFISNELDLPWYKHMEFQKHLRQVLNDFKSECEENPNQNYFVGFFYCHFINRLNFYDIKQGYERERVEKDFKGISECWHLIQESPSDEYLWLARFHKKLKSALNKPVKQNNP